MAGTCVNASVGEIVESSTTQFVAECLQGKGPPAFGSFVRVGPGKLPGDDPFAAPAIADGAVYAVVCESRTVSREPGRRPAAYGLDTEALRREQPQLDELLATEFTALVIGYSTSDRIYIALPPQPPRVHAFAEPCSPREVQLLTENLDFVRAVVAWQTLAASDELAAAALRIAAQERSDGPEFLVRAGKTIAVMLRSDFSRVDAILRKLAG
jgi:hypothetical protein